MDQLDPRLLAALLGQGAGGGGGAGLPALPRPDGPDSRKKAQIEAQIRNSPNELFKTIHQWQVANVRFENTARVDTIRNLLDDPALRGAINVVDSEDCSVLFYAMQSRQHKASRLLIEAGADVFGTVEHSPLRLLFFGMKGPVGSNTMLFTKWLFSHLEAQGKKQEAIECLSRHPCPLLVLSMKKREQLLAIELLLQLGVSPAISHAGGWTALHHACKKGHVGLTRLLLAHGADINAVKNDGYTPLHLAAFNGHCEVVEQLLMAGAMTQALTGESEERPVLSRKTAADLADIDNHPYAAYIIRTWDYWHTPTVQPIPDNDDVMTDSNVA